MKDLNLTIKNVFIYRKRNFVALVLYFIFLIGLAFLLNYVPFLRDNSIWIVLILFVITFILLIVYKSITKCDEDELLKLGINLCIISAVIQLIFYSYSGISIGASGFMFLFSQLIYAIYTVFITGFPIIGLIHIIYSKTRIWIMGTSAIIGIIAQYISMYYLSINPLLGNWSLNLTIVFLSCIQGILLFYAYLYLKNFVKCVAWKIFLAYGLVLSLLDFIYRYFETLNTHGYIPFNLTSVLLIESGVILFYVIIGVFFQLLYKNKLFSQDSKYWNKRQ